MLRIDKTEIENRALTLRQERNIQTYGVKDIFSVIEQKDIHLIRYPFGKNVLLGLSTVYEGKKVIVSNSSEILSREIFTIAHELGHILYDFEECNQDIKIDIDIEETGQDIAEERAFYFANCFLMPQEQLSKFIKFALNKTISALTALDIVRIQLEFNVSYSAAVKRLHEVELITLSQRNKLFNKRNEVTSTALFKMLDADEKLLKAAGLIKIPNQYLEYVTSNYENDYIPFSSLKNALNLLGMDAEMFKKEEVVDDEEINIDDIFEEFE